MRDVNHFGRGEAVIEEGHGGRFDVRPAARDSASFRAEKRRRQSGSSILRRGDCFGEMSLLTGEKRTATVRAEQDCEVMEISQDRSWASCCAQRQHVSIN